MTRIIGIYGVIGGIIVAIGMLLGITFVSDHGVTGMIVGYLTMLVAMSMVFVGVKQYRDTELGGIIRFWTALGVGLAIAAVAALFYVAAWEAYMYATDFRFIDEYVASATQNMKDQGKAAAEIARFEKDMSGFKDQYAQPLFRIAITFTEIAPVGILAALVSAATLRKSSVLPARS